MAHLTADDLAQGQGDPDQVRADQERGIAKALGAYLTFRGLPPAEENSWGVAAARCRALDGGFAGLGTAVEALDILDECRDRGVRVSLLSTGNNMPGMMGFELLDLLAERTPGIPSLLICGGVDPLISQRLLAEGKILRHLHKPWRISELSPLVRSILVWGRP